MQKALKVDKKCSSKANVCDILRNLHAVLDVELCEGMVVEGMSLVAFLEKVFLVLVISKISKIFILFFLTINLNFTILANNTIATGQQYYFIQGTFSIFAQARLEPFSSYCRVLLSHHLLP